MAISLSKAAGLPPGATQPGVASIKAPINIIAMDHTMHSISAHTHRCSLWVC